MVANYGARQYNGTNTEKKKGEGKMRKSQKKKKKIMLKPVKIQKEKEIKKHEQKDGEKNHTPEKTRKNTKTVRTKPGMEQAVVKVCAGEEVIQKAT